MATKKVDLKSDEVRELLGTSPAWLIRWGSALLLLLLVALIVMAYFIQYPTSLQFPVTVSTSIESTAIQASKQGRIRFWLVEPGENVTAHQPVALQANQADYNHVLAIQERLDKFDPEDPATFRDFGDLDGLNLGSLNPLLDDFRKSLQPQKVQSGGSNKELRFKKKQSAALRTLVKELERELPDVISTARAWEKSFMDARASYSSGDISVEELQRIEAISTQKNEELEKLEEELAKRREDLKAVETAISKMRPSGTREVLDSSAIREAFTNLVGTIDTWLEEHLILAPIAGEINFLDDPNMVFQEGDSLANIEVAGKETLVLSGSTILPADISEKALSFYLLDEAGEEIQLHDAQLHLEKLSGSLSKVSIILEEPGPEIKKRINQSKTGSLEGRLYYGKESFLKRLWKDFGSLD